jgi:ABC-type uncharacterized transport system permease subunit
VNWQQFLTTTFIVGFLASSIRLATPLLFTALGEIFAERAGILNIGVEGIMIIGAFAGFVASYLTGSPWIGAVCALLAGVLMSCQHAYLTATLAKDQIVSGLATNFFALGFVLLGFRAFFGMQVMAPQAATFTPVAIPILSSIPYIGDIFFKHDIWVYVSWLLVPICYLVLFKTSWGLNITAVGENPSAAEAAGINVVGVRFRSVVIGGALAGLGGMVLCLTNLGLFTEMMVSGRGFIAIAIVLFGRWHPLYAFGAALIFGLADALQLRFQTMGAGSVISPTLMVAFPYFITLVLVLFSKRGNLMPKTLCTPYKGSEER